MMKQKLSLKMNQAKMDLSKMKSESKDIYQTLCNNVSMYKRCLELECESINESILNSVAVMFTNYFTILTGSAGEGTDISSYYYVKRGNSATPSYNSSDVDLMYVLCGVHVIEEGDTLPQRFNNCMYLQAERGEHTTDGFRKLRIIHSPEYYSEMQYRAKEWARFIHMSVEHGYMSSSKLLAATVPSVTTCLPLKHTIQTGFGTQGPSQILERQGSAYDTVRCFHVKTWPKEAESWFTRKTHWPDKNLKSKIRKLGYLLVPTGNSNSQERDLEWRCSFSIAEKILFQSLNKFQRCTFIMLKALLKEYLPSDINTDGENQLLSTYHIKTLFLWCLEERKLKWVPENMLGNMGHMFDKLRRWLNRQYFPHYFIPSVNLLDVRRLHGRKKSLIFFISTIRNDLSNKIKQSQFFMDHKTSIPLTSKVDRFRFMLYIHHYVMQCCTGRLQIQMHKEVFNNAKKINSSHSFLIEGLLSIKPVIDPQVQSLYRAMYSDPVHGKLLTEVIPGLIDQYRGCIHMAKYCMAARDGYVFPGMLYTAVSLLKDTLHIDPCSGYVKLACLYIATGDFDQAMDRLHAAENNFLLIHNNMETSVLRYLQLNRVEFAFTHEVFQKWAEGQVDSDIVVTWPEYITAPDLIQFELIHESTQQIRNVPYDIGRSVKMVALDWFLQWPPLCFINLLKFVCVFMSGGLCTTHMEKLAEALMITGVMSLGEGPRITDMFTVFNMTAWCYVKIKKYKPAVNMMVLAIGISSKTAIMKRSAFSHFFFAYIIEQCLARENRVLVYNRDNVLSRKTKSWYTREEMSGQKKRRHSVLKLNSCKGIILSVIIPMLLWFLLHYIFFLKDNLTTNQFDH